MLDLDIEKFWEDDKTAHDENCFSKNSKQVAMGIYMSDECVFAELGEEGQPWGITPADRRLDLNKRYNEKALKIVGRKLLSEAPPAPADSRLPMLKQIGEIFGGEKTYTYEFYEDEDGNCSEECTCEGNKENEEQEENGEE